MKNASGMQRFFRVLARFFASRVALHPLKFCREMSKHWCFLDDTKAAQLAPIRVNLLGDLNDVIDMALCVDATWNGKTDKLHRRRDQSPHRIIFSEHYTPDLHGSDSPNAVQLAHDGLTGILMRGDMRCKSLCIQVDRVSARRPNDWHSNGDEFLA